MKHLSLLDQLAYETLALISFRESEQVIGRLTSCHPVRNRRSAVQAAGLPVSPPAPRGASPHQIRLSRNCSPLK